MKRGGPLKRKTRLKSSSGLSRGEGLKRSKRVNPKNAARLKKRRAVQFGDQAQICRESSCISCGSPPPCDPAHVISRGAGGKDEHTVPLCRSCHDDQHALGVRTFERFKRRPGAESMLREELVRRDPPLDLKAEARRIAESL